jgi:hypothetical protein
MQTSSYGWDVSVSLANASEMRNLMSIIPNHHLLL